MENESTKEYLDKINELNMLVKELRGEIAQNNKSLKTLKENENHYRDLFENNPNPMWIYDMDTLFFLEVNDAAIEHYGYSKEEFLSMTLNDIRPVEDIPKLHAFIANMDRKFRTSSGWRHVIKNGTIIDVEISSHQLAKRSIKRQRLILVNDVTERIRFESEILKSEKRYKELADNLPIGIYETDLEGQMTFANETILKWFGYCEEDLIKGFKLFDLIIEDEREELLKNFRNVSESGQQTQTEYKAKKNNGWNFHILLSASPIVKDGKVSGICGTVQDFTNRKKAEKAILNSEIQFRTLYERASDGIIYLTLNGEIVQINEAYAKMHGYTIEEMHFYNMNADSPSLLSHEQIRRIEYGENLRFEVQHYHKNGQIIVLDISTCLLPLEKENLIVAFHRDITERKQVEEKLLQQTLNLEKMLELSQSLGSTMNIDILLKMIVEKTVNINNLDAGALYLVVGNELFLTATEPAIPANMPESFRYARIDDHPHIKLALKTKEVIFIEDALLELWTPQEEQVRLARKLLSIMYVPLLIEDRMLGILILGTVTKKRVFNREEIDMCKMLSAQIALVIDNASLFGKTQKYTAELEQKNKDLKFLSDLALQFTELPYSGNITGHLINKLKEYTGAAIIASSKYDEDSKCLIINEIKTDKKLLDRVIEKFGKKFLKTPAPVSDDTYGILIAEMAGIRNTLTEISFGKIPESIDKAFKALTGIKYYYAIVLAVSGKLLGALILAFRDGQKLPQKELMISVGNLASITLRRYEAERALYLNEAKQKAMITNISDVISIIDKNGIITYESPNIEREFGWTPDNVMGKQGFDFVHPEDVVRMKQTFEGILISKESTVIIECRYRCKDGSYKWVRNALIKRLHDPSIRGVLINFHDITERKKSEEALSKFQLGIERSPEAIFITDPDGKITYINPSFSKIYGYSAKESIGRTPGILKSGVYNDEVYAAFWSTLLSKKPVEGELINKRKDGQLITIEGGNNPILDNDDKIIGFLAIHYDVSLKKEKEENLRFSEERFKQVAETAGEWIWEVNTNGLYTYSSPIVEKILGYTIEEIVGEKHFYDLYAPETCEELKKEAFKVFETKERFNKLIKENISKEGKIVYLETTGAPIFNESGTLIGYRGTDSDVTDRILNEEKLRKLSLAVEQSPASIIITNMKGDIEYVNSSFSQITGYSYEEAIGNNPRMLKSGKTLENEYKELWSNITAGKEWKGEFYNRKKNGDCFWESASISPILNKNGEITHYLGIKEDITERKEAAKYVIDKIIETEERERLRYSNELHDGLGPIISTIKLYFQLLEDNNDPDQKKLIFTKIANCIDEAIQSLKEISHNLSPNVVNNFGLIAGVQSFISRIKETEIFNIDFTFNFERRFDRNVEITFYRIITEMINNTVKYANASQVWIKLNYSEEESHITLEYTDNGRGFELEKASYKGRGLGLSSIFQRVNAMNGKLNIDTAIGKGVKVWIELSVKQ